MALKVEASEESHSVLGQSRVKSLPRLEKWSLDPDFLEEGPQGGKEKFSHITKDILAKKFQNEKYLEEVLPANVVNFQGINRRINRLLDLSPVRATATHSHRGDSSRPSSHISR